MNTLKLGWTGLGIWEINGDEPTKQVLKYRFSIVPKKRRAFTLAAGAKSARQN
jgi:hypothetical protein